MNPFIEIPPDGLTALSRPEALAYVEQEAPDKINHFRKAYSGSLRSAITAMCLGCRDFTEIEIRGCNRKACPLWEQRPYKEPKPRRNNHTEKTDAPRADVEVNYEKRLD